MIKTSSLLAGLSIVLLTPSGAAAVSQQPVGAAQVVVNLVTAAFNRDTRTLQSGDRVHQNELIEVGLDASSELRLDDDTNLALGPGSRLTLDKFVYDPSKTKGSIVLDLVKGTFRFMTGVAAKPTYVIKTPAAAITVRGTIFDVYVEDDGLSWLLLHEGAVEVCNQRGQCRDLDEPGKIIRISDDGDVGPPVRWAGLEGNDRVPFDKAFPFVVDVPEFDPEPVFTRDQIIFAKLPAPPPPKYEKPKTYEQPKRAETKPKWKKKAERSYEEKPRKKKREANRGGSDAAKAIMLGVGVGVGLGMIKNRGGGKPGHYGHKKGKY